MPPLFSVPISLDMKKENSYGIIPLRFCQGQWEVLLIQHWAGHWAFPKGHAEHQESHQETAERELLEETGLKVVRYISNTPLLENYVFTFQEELIQKTVYYFPAQVEGMMTLQQKEIQNSLWLPLAEAEEQITFREGKKICEEVRKLLSSG